jgi:EmrB/QacA subfamily drug resistance transporter
MLQLGLIVFSVASLLAGTAQGSTMLIFARGLQGLGAAFIAPAALSLLTNTFPDGPERNKALGVWGGLSGLASVVGVVLGGVLTEGPGWRWVFFINVPIGLVAAALAPKVVPESRSPAQRRNFDTTGAVVLTACLVLLIYTLGQTVNWGWTSGATIGCLAAVAVLLASFVTVERHARTPLIPLGIFKLKTLRTANITAVFMLATLVTLFFFASLFIQQVMGYSPVQTGLAYVPIALIVAVGAGVSSKLVTRLPGKPVLIAGLALAAAGMLLLWRLPVHASYALDVLPAFLVGGLGIGMAFVPLQVAAFGGVGERDHGLAAGLINTSQEAGGALGVAVAATIAFSRIPELTTWAGDDPARVTQARAQVFHTAFLVGACFAAVAVAVAMLLPMLRPPQPTAANGVDAT